MSEANKMSAANQKKSCCWSVTINNPTTDDYQQWESLKGLHWVRSVEGQVEKGEEGTLHIQGCVRTTSVRFSQLKTALPRAHIEQARSPAALAKYVVKEDTRVSGLPSVKVATQADVQKRILDLTLARYLEGGGENKKHLFYAWLTNVEHSKLLRIENTHQSLEYWIDTAVGGLILEGYYGVEFVMCNPQVRMAFKKYFAEIIIRQYGAPQVSPPRAPQAAEDQEGSSELPQGD